MDPSARRSRQAERPPGPAAAEWVCEEGAQVMNGRERSGFPQRGEGLWCKPPPAFPAPRLCRCPREGLRGWQRQQPPPGKLFSLLLPRSPSFQLGRLTDRSLPAAAHARSRFPSAGAGDGEGESMNETGRQRARAPGPGRAAADTAPRAPGRRRLAGRPRWVGRRTAGSSAAEAPCPQPLPWAAGS